MRKLNRGELLTKEELEEISKNYVVTTHAKERIRRRGFCKKSIKSVILNPLVAYFNTDYSINIAQDKYHYFVVKYNEIQGKYVVVTYKEPSCNGKSIFHKRKMAIKGKNRVA